MIGTIKLLLQHFVTERIFNIMECNSNIGREQFKNCQPVHSKVYWSICTKQELTWYKQTSLVYFETILKVCLMFHAYSNLDTKKINFLFFVLFC